MLYIKKLGGARRLREKREKEPSTNGCANNNLTFRVSPDIRRPLRSASFLLSSYLLCIQPHFISSQEIPDVSRLTPAEYQ